MVAGNFQFLVTIEFMATGFFKASERKTYSSNTDIAVLCNGIICIASPLPYSLGSKQVRGSTHIQREFKIQRHIPGKRIMGITLESVILFLV